MAQTGLVRIPWPDHGAHRRVKVQRKSDLPFGSQFTPSQTPLEDLLRLVAKHEGNLEQLTQAIEQQFFASHGTDDHSRREVARNTILSLRAYGILDQRGKLTDLGRQLVSALNDSRRLYDLLARHILLHLHGLDLVQAVIDMRRLGVSITLETLRRELERRGVHMPRGGMHISAMKGWLEKAGVFKPGSRYDVDEARIKELVGLNPEEIALLADLPQPLRAFVRALAALSPDGRPLPSNKVAEYASDLYGVSFPEKSLPKALAPLVDAGLVTLTKTTQGRGAKPHLVCPTERLRKDVIQPLLNAMASAAGFPATALWYQPLSTTLEQLRSNERHVKGQALERLAVYLCWLLDLQFRGWRRRGKETAGAEVDVLAEAARLVFNRWQIQCKNTYYVSLDDVAREVGVASVLRPHIILIVTSGRVGQEARAYATDVMKQTYLNIAFLDRDDLQRIASDPSAVIDVLRREAEHAMEIKRSEAEELGEPRRLTLEYQTSTKEDLPTSDTWAADSGSG